MGEELQRGAQIQGRYRLERELGGGGFGTTWLAEDMQTGQRVALKRLRMDRVEEWKAVELFQREAEVLRGLQHECIPAYLDAFEVSDDHDALSFYLAQEYIEGRTLEDLITSGDWRPDEGEVVGALVQVLDILEYLQSRRPPIVHRDLKPSNIIRRPDGRLALIDFGAVKAAWDGLGQQSTVAGTFGYMAPEQLRGQATPAADIYGLGATALFLLSGEDPARLPGDGLKIDFRAAMTLSPGLAAWLDRALAVSPGDRFASAQQAREALLQGQRPDRGDELGDDEVALLFEEDEQPAIVFEQSPPDAPEQKAPTALPERAAMPERVPGPLRVGVIFWSVVLLGLVAAPWVFPLGVIGSVVVAVGSAVTAIALSVSSQLELNHPKIRLIEKRRELGLWLGLVVPALAVQFTGIGISAVRADTGAFWALCGVLALWYLFVTVIPSTIYDATRAFGRHLRTEQATDQELPVPAANETPTIPFEVVELVPGERLHLRRERTGWKGVGLWMMCVMQLFALAASAAAVSGVGSSSEVGLLGVFALMMGVGAAASWLKGAKGAPMELIIDRSAGTVTWDSEADGEGRQSASLRHMRGWGVSTQGKAIKLEAERNGTPTTLWSMEEAHDLMRAEERQQLERALDMIFADEPRQDVVLDLQRGARADATAAASALASVARR